MKKGVGAVDREGNGKGTYEDCGSREVRVWWGVGQNVSGRQCKEGHAPERRIPE